MGRGTAVSILNEHLASCVQSVSKAKVGNSTFSVAGNKILRPSAARGIGRSVLCLAGVLLYSVAIGKSKYVLFLAFRRPKEIRASPLQRLRRCDVGQAIDRKEGRLFPYPPR